MWPNGCNIGELEGRSSAGGSGCWQGGTTGPRGIAASPSTSNSRSCGPQQPPPDTAPTSERAPTWTLNGSASLEATRYERAGRLEARDDERWGNGPCLRRSRPILVLGEETAALHQHIELLFDVRGDKESMRIRSAAWCGRGASPENRDKVLTSRSCQQTNT